MIILDILQLETQKLEALKSDKPVGIYRELEITSDYLKQFEKEGWTKVSTSVNSHVVKKLFELTTEERNREIAILENRLKLISEYQTTG